MRTLAIPTTPGLAYYTQRTRLDGREYNLRFAWNQGAERWTLDILDSEDTPIVVGIKLVTNWPLLRAYQYDARVPQGDLRVTTLMPDDRPPGYHDLGIGLRCELTYFSATDF